MIVAAVQWMQGQSLPSFISHNNGIFVFVLHFSVVLAEKM
jgi:hypothetical protein